MNDRQNLNKPQNDDVSYSIADLRYFTDEQFQEFYDYISEDRRKKADSYKLKQDWKLSVLASFQLERLLEGMGVKKPIRYTTTPGGKPLLDMENTEKEIYFSISHSGNFATAVVSDKYSVGIDVEDVTSKKRDLNKLMKVADKYFLPEEIELINQATGGDERALPGAFYRIWTMKEAYMKAIGKPLLEVFREKQYDPDDVALTQKYNSEAIFSIYRAVPHNL
jgi:4'-phosphopantetheinyl transferase